MSAFVPVIESLLDTDLYKFTMWQTMLHRSPGASAEYTFACRRAPERPLARLAGQLDAQLDHLCALRFAPDELAYLRALRFMKPDFVDFLSIFSFQRRFIEVGTDGDALRVVARGPQVHVMAFEVFVLSIVNELHFRDAGDGDGGGGDGDDDDDGVGAGAGAASPLETGRVRLAAKIERLRALAREPARRFPFEFFDFGARRRFSRDWHDEVVGTLVREVPQYFKGTSDVRLAQRHSLAAIGTMAHEYLQSHQALGVRLRDFQRAALEGWVAEYRGDLGIALTDVVGMRAFLRDFDLYFAKLFDGLRHDSGDPFAWGEAAIEHYRRLRIDPCTKRLVFSDGLDVERAIALHHHFADRIQVGFGIGTNLTNDTGRPALNVVMKLTRCNGQPVAKLSDSAGKTMCDDPTFLAYLSQVFEQPQ